MIYDSDILSILDECDTLNHMILNSESYHHYKNKCRNVQFNGEVQKLKKDLIKVMDKYNEVTRFGRYHPDYQTVMMDMRRKKKAYEMHPDVSDMKLAETKLQTVLDEVISIIAMNISSEVKVETGNPFFETHSCSSGCGCST